MDDATFQSLRAAFAASPDNAALLGVLLGACRARRDTKAGLALLGERTADALLPADRVTAARLLLESGDHARARDFYDSAVAASRTHEDAELAASLSATVEFTKEGPKLRLLRSGAAEGAPDPGLAFAAPREKVTFADVGGLDALKENIRRRILLPRQKPSLFERFRKKVGGGVLLYGPPGCGKTLIARATAGECGSSFLSVGIADVLDMYVGESENNLKGLFERARAQAPTVLFFDEVEALGGRRQHNHSSATANLVSQFLSEMDGFASRNEGVLILGATNVPWAVDPAFRRPGRFDRVLFVPPPDRAAREAILRIHLKDRPCTADVDVGALAAKTSGWSGADLENVVETAADIAIAASLGAEQEVPICQRHLTDALAELRPTTSEWLATARNYARYANEAGQYDEVLAFLDKNGRG
ncbi:MAG: ATP-binding protein [Pseudomonadota bacterium]|nr:ATP-binding protein [Pseudomonadota bacterium]